MLALLIRKELLDQIRSLRFSMACIICPVVILSSVFVLARDYRDAAMDYHTNLVMHGNQLEQVRFPHLLTQNGYLVDTPLNPMKVFFSGVDVEHTATVRVSGVSAPEVQSDLELNPVALMFPVMDLTFVAAIIMSLLAIAFSYDAFSGERESGTLKVLMSYSVPRDLLLLSKWIGGYLALIAPFLLAVLLGLSVSLLFPDLDLSSQDWSSLLLALVGVLVYLSAVYALGLLVSARTAQASTSITVLLLVWVLMVLVYPNLAPYVAGLLEPAPSMQSIEAEKRRLQDEEQGRFIQGFTTWVQAAEKRGAPVSEILAKYKEMESGMTERVRAGHGALDERFRTEMDEQIQLGRRIAMVSPAALFTVTVCDLAGTGVQEKGHFRAVLGRYADQWLTWAYGKFNPDIYEGKAKLDVTDRPVFRYAPQGLGERLGESAPDMLVLLVWNLVFLLLAHLALMRYDVR